MPLSPSLSIGLKSPWQAFRRSRLAPRWPRFDVARRLLDGAGAGSGGLSCFRSLASSRDEPWLGGSGDALRCCCSR
jgi:hypothetical protein